MALALKNSPNPRFLGEFLINFIKFLYVGEILWTNAYEQNVGEQHAVQKRVLFARRIIEATVRHTFWLDRFGSDTVGGKYPAHHLGFQKSSKYIMW